MKVNRNTIITLSIISIILLVLIIIPEILCKNTNARFESITLNILCGCTVSIVMCIVNYTIEKRRIEEMIFQKLISNYCFLSILNSPLLVDIDGNELYDSKYDIYSKLLKDIHERNRYFQFQDENYDTYFTNDKTKLYKEIAIFSNGFDIESIIMENISFVEHNSRTKKEVYENICEFADDKMTKTDLYMQKIKKYKKDFDWNQYKKEICI